MFTSRRTLSLVEQSSWLSFTLLPEWRGEMGGGRHDELYFVGDGRLRWAVPASHESWLCSLLCLYTEQMDSHHSVYLNVTAAPRIEQKNNYSQPELTSEAKQEDLARFSWGDPRHDLLSCHGIKASTGALLVADWVWWGMILYIHVICMPFMGYCLQLDLTYFPYQSQWEKDSVISGISPAPIHPDLLSFLGYMYTHMHI